MDVVSIQYDRALTPFEEIREGFSHDLQPPNYSTCNKIAAITRIVMPVVSFIAMFSSLIAMGLSDNESEKINIGSFFGYFSGTCVASFVHLSLECCCNSFLNITSLILPVISGVGVLFCTVLGFSQNRVSLEFIIASGIAIGTFFTSSSFVCCIYFQRNSYVHAIKRRICP